MQPDTLKASASFAQEISTALSLHVMQRAIAVRDGMVPPASLLQGIPFQLRGGCIHRISDYHPTSSRWGDRSLVALF